MSEFDSSISSEVSLAAPPPTGNGSSAVVEFVDERDEVSIAG